MGTIDHIVVQVIFKKGEAVQLEGVTGSAEGNAILQVWQEQLMYLK